MGKGDLKALIAERKGDRSYDQLERDSGGTPTAGRWQQMATRPPKNIPETATLIGMARALGVTVTEVVMAAARSCGMDVREDSHGSLSTAGLTPRQTQVVRMVISELAAKEDTRHGAPIGDDLVLEEDADDEGGAITLREKDSTRSAQRRGTRKGAPQGGKPGA